VNLFGQVAVTQAFLPLIRSHNNKNHTGRVIFVGIVKLLQGFANIYVGSGIGLIAVPMVGSYCSTKMALEAIVDAWRVELKPWNINVVDVVSGKSPTIVI
jgi:NAD(P)-dependent dehydrogenase (short-subunit alcohol dehydrogenase family)